MNAVITHLPPLLLAACVALTVLCIGVLIWCALPRTRTQRDADIERQIKTLRDGADHAVATRPRVRAHSAKADHFGAATNMVKPKSCGAGLCRHQADCSDHYCPGRLSASLTGTEARHARH